MTIIMMLLKNAMIMTKEYDNNDDDNDGGQGLHGGTTVSSTMLFASAASIPLFVTGGVGGVHRGAATSGDISADLTELGRTRVCVVSAGVKV